MTKRDLVVASIRHHPARLLKYYPRRPCAPSFVKSRMLRPLQTHFLLFQQIFFVLACIHPGTPITTITTRESRTSSTGKISVRGLDSIHYRPEEAWCKIRDLLYDWRKLRLFSTNFVQHYVGHQQDNKDPNLSAYHAYHYVR